jgi:hypothetical protein
MRESRWKWSGLVLVRLLVGQRQVLRSWCMQSAGLVVGLRDAVLDSSLL